MSHTRRPHSKGKERLYAILSDLHANFPALQAVEEDAQRLAQEENLPAPSFVCLGDVVDYGPHPNQCMDWMRRRVSVVVSGNHDEEMPGTLYSPPHPNIREDWWPILLWTRRSLKPEHKRAMAGWPSTLIAPCGLEPFTLFHGSMQGNRDRIVDAGNAAWNLGEIRTPYGLFGHTHYQGYFQLERGKRAKLYLLEADQVCHWQDMPVRQTLFNPGAVGQPRQPGAHFDRPMDYRAAYMLIHMVGDGAERLQFRRVDYDCLKTVQDLNKIHWEPNGNKPVNGCDTTRQGQAGEHRVDLGHQIPADYIHRLPDLLSDLVRKVLIPQLACGQRDADG